MKKIKFTKYHGCGNDFIIVKEKDILEIDITSFVIDICNRYTGIGADGLMIDMNDTIEMKFYNQDGRSGTMCGNGLRSFCAYLQDTKKVTSNKFDVITPAGIMKINMLNNNPYIFNVNLGKPSFESKKLQIDTNSLDFINQIIKFKERDIICSAVFIGTKHLVVFTNDINDLTNEELGLFLSKNPLFIDDINVDFVYKLDENNVRMKTYERGVGFTKACGTGACATYIISKLQNRDLTKLSVHMDLGTLTITDINEEIIMEGPAEKICEGTFNWRK